ncbi:MAG TPA: MarR family transcriptional regulator, partial [Polyangiaceae bacterium]|nr:MarR family transcriptional regulator [Polyangiaceae bacterium]
LGSVLDFLRLIWAVDHALQRSSKHMEMTTGVTDPQRLAIRVIGKFPGITAGQLATLLHVHPGTLTGILKRLQRQGLIRRRPDARDGRRSLLGLTDKGRMLEIETQGTVEVALQHVLATTPPERLQAAREVLESFASHLSTSLVAGSGSPIDRN